MSAIVPVLETSPINNSLWSSQQFEDFLKAQSGRDSSPLKLSELPAGFLVPDELEEVITDVNKDTVQSDLESNSVVGFRDEEIFAPILMRGKRVLSQ